MRQCGIGVLVGKKKKRHLEKWNRIEIPGTDPHNYSQLISDKRAKEIQWRKDSLFNKWCWNNWIPIYKKDTRHSPYTFHIN